MTVSGTIPIFANTKMLSMATSRLGMRAFDQIEMSSPNAMNARTTAAAQMASMRGGGPSSRGGGRADKVVRDPASVGGFVRLPDRREQRVPRRATAAVSGHSLGL